MKAVIMCGGIASKMWPVSRSRYPKHFVKIWHNKSLFELNYEALRIKFLPRDIYVQTNSVQAVIARRLIPEIPRENYFIEPQMRNHGPATGFAAAKLFKIQPDEPFTLVQADDLRIPVSKYIEMPLYFFNSSTKRCIKDVLPQPGSPYKIIPLFGVRL